jgi:membrane-bound lytic murein transglycosylase D
MGVPTHIAITRALAAAAVSLSLWATSASALVTQRAETDDDRSLFPRPAEVNRRVKLWTKIFHKYPSTTVIVHEIDDPNRIVDLIDYRVYAGRENRTGPVPRREREDVTSKYLKRYVKAVDRFATEGEAAVRHGAIEKRIYRVYSQSPEALARLYAGKVKLRAQTGLADDYVQASAIARAYFPYMEQVFRQAGVPVRLTRLAFVESMFNLKARSKVGASGIWQFMPDTARNYVSVTSMVDERNNPYKATRAAAQLLLTNYRELGSWPLAITAYNHGRMGMMKAIKQLATDDLGEIIKRYESGSFGFASKNFYAEFLAAADTYDLLMKEGKVGDPITLPKTETIVLKTPTSVAQLLHATPLTKETIQEFNGCLQDSALTVHARKALPPLYELRVPIELAEHVRAGIASLKSKRYVRR